MVLIIGGAYQGKLDYALKRFGLKKGDVYFCSDIDAASPHGKKIIYEVDKWILALTREGGNVTEKIASFIAENVDAIVICNDISSGVVPIDPILRSWREEVGRAVGCLAQNSDEVVRLFCTIPTRIK